MALYQDFLTVTIDAVDVSDYVIGYQRNESLCDPGQTFTLLMTRKKFDDSMLDIGVSEAVVITEKYPSGSVVLKGYVTNVEIDASSAVMRVTGADKYVLLHDYFIDARLETAGESVQYWINYICNLAELSVQFDAIPGIPTDGKDGNGGTPLGMQKAADSLRILERKGAVYTRYDSSIDKIRVFRLTTSQPQVTIATNNLETFNRTEGTDFTRNVVKVWGGDDYDWITGESRQYLAVARKEMSELPVDKTIYLANPEIRSQTFARIIATRMLAISATLDDIVIAECAGLYPDINIADFASLYISQGHVYYAADRQITSISISVNNAGAKTTFTFGEKCPRVTFSPPPFYVYATYQASGGGGVGISYDAGDTFYPFNTGLESVSGLAPVSIAANTYNQLMMAAVSGVYKRSGIYGSWTRITALDAAFPSNDEKEYQYNPGEITFIRAEKETGSLNKFHLLAEVYTGPIPSGEQRCWAYWTKDFGSTWDSMQLYVPGSGLLIGEPSGLSPNLINGIGIPQSDLATVGSGAVAWNVTPLDMEGDKAGNITTLLIGEPTGIYEPGPSDNQETMYTAAIQKTATETHWACGTWFLSCYTDGESATPNRIYDQSMYNTGLILPIGLLGQPNNIFSIPNNREIAYALASNQIGNYIKVARTIGNYDTKPIPPPDYTDIPEWELVTSPNWWPSADEIPSSYRWCFLDYSSLEPSTNTARFCCVWADLTQEDNGGDNYPTNTYITITVYFFEDDITVGPSTSLSWTIDTVKLGVASYGGSPLTYYGDGLYGWENVGGDTGSPGPRRWDTIYAGGGRPAAVTKGLTGNNKAYFALAVHDRGLWHGDDRDAGWPETQHPRDWEEYGNIGVYVIELDFNSETISNVICENWFMPDLHEDPPSGSQPQRDIDLTDFSDFTEYNAYMLNTDWICYMDWHGTSEDDKHWFFIDYPDWSIEHTKNDLHYTWLDPHSVRKVPYYSNVSAYQYQMRPSGGAKRFLRPGYGWIDSNPPPDTNPQSIYGQPDHVRQHKNQGICTSERRAVGVWSGSPFPPSTYDYTFMWQAQRTSPGNFTVIGNNAETDDPYGQDATPEHRDRIYNWDFRTADGSTGMSGGGNVADWNWVD